MTSPSKAEAGGRRVLVTGAGGQDGSYLCEQLAQEGATVFAMLRPGQRCRLAGVTPVEADLRDGASVARAVAEAEPDEVYHLAAASFVPDADRDAAVDSNALGIERLAEALGRQRRVARLLNASSAEIFGPPTGRPQNEEHPQLAASAYGRAKLRAHRFVVELRERHGLFACSAILFNHESPRRPPVFVTRKITIAAARIARGLQSSVTLGNLDAARDWGYAPEYTDAMRRMLRAELPRDYVVATGRATTVGEFAALAFAHAGLDWTEHVRSEPSLERHSDAAARIGDATKIEHDLGWKAATTVEQLAALMVDADLALLDEPEKS